MKKIFVSLIVAFSCSLIANASALIQPLNASRLVTDGPEARQIIGALNLTGLVNTSGHGPIVNLGKVSCWDGGKSCAGYNNQNTNGMIGEVSFRTNAGLAFFKSLKSAGVLATSSSAEVEMTILRVYCTGTFEAPNCEVYFLNP